jgi:hypothetical protein
MSTKIRSAVVIAKLLGTEGFTDYVANQVEQYFRRRSGLTQRQKNSIKKLDAEVARICENMPIGDRKVLGSFIGLHKKMSFDTGLKIGLQTYAQKTDKEVECH